MSDEAAVQALVTQVQRNARYAHIAPGLVARIAREELGIRRNAKEAVKHTRRRLHQAGAVYMAGAPPYERWLASLREAQGDRERLQAVCSEAMAAHQSSRERLPLLERFYTEVLVGLAPVASVLDLACGLNPLAIPWMPLAPGARYAAYDVYTDLAAFLQEALPLLGVEGEAHAIDLSARTPDTSRGCGVGTQDDPLSRAAGPLGRGAALARDTRAPSGGVLSHAEPGRAPRPGYAGHLSRALRRAGARSALGGDRARLQQRAGVRHRQGPTVTRTGVTDAYREVGAKLVFAQGTRKR
jgi:hypothetical protein